MSEGFLRLPDGRRAGTPDAAHRAHGVDIARVKARLDFPSLVAQTHPINQDRKINCPVHNDKHPSCHVYEDHVHCYSCGWHADAIEWLERIQGFSTGQAIREAARLADELPIKAMVGQRKRTEEPLAPLGQCDALPEHIVVTHLWRVERTRRVPPALVGRGFAATDMSELAIAEAQTGGDALLAIFNPEGNVVNVKRRFGPGLGGRRYQYEHPGRGAPAWCSPGILSREVVLAIEGELNAQACWLARPEIGVMGLAGVHGRPYPEVFAGRTVYVYADGDEPGVAALDRWARMARDAGASRVATLAPWPDGDACDIAGSRGRERLGERLP